MSPVIQGLWLGSDLTDLEILCIRSFQHHGHEFHLYAYEPMTNVPQGTVIRDANEILPESAVYRSRNGGLSSFADYFRWELLKKRGGVWVDMDVICLKPFEFSDDVIFGYESENLLNIAVLMFPPGHFMPKVMAKACDDVNCFQPIDTTKTIIKKVARKLLLGKDKSRIYANHTEPGGPPYFTKFVRYYDLLEHAKPQHWFYPFPYWEWQEIFQPSDNAEAKIKDSYAVHVWHNAMHRDPHMDKDQLRFKGTLIGQLRDRYMP